MKKLFLLLLVSLTCSFVTRALNPGVYVGCDGGYSFHIVVNGYGVVQYMSQTLNPDCNHDWTVQIMTIKPITMQGIPHDPGMELTLNNNFDPSQMTSNIPAEWRARAERALSQEGIPISYVHTEHLNQNVANYLLAHE